MNQQMFCCVKCGNREYDADQFQATGGAFSKIFDIQNKKFATIICTRCGYTEIYRQEGSLGMDVLDFFTNR